MKAKEKANTKGVLAGYNDTLSHGPEVGDSGEA